MSCTALLSVSFASCDDGVERAMQAAGKNSAELQKVIDLYADEGGLRYKAAEFLVENMLVHHTRTSAAVDSFVRRMLKADTLESRELTKWWKEYRKADKPVCVYDVKTLDVRFLAANIDAACRVYDAVPWKEDIDEDMFLNYILPYRISDEPLSPTGWRDSLYHRYHPITDTITDMKRAYYAVYRAVSAEVRVRLLGDMTYLMSVADAGRIKRGRCLQQCVYIASVMRALGIPAVVDGVSRWANYSTTGHSWVALVTRDGTYTVYGDDTIARKHNPINSSSFSLKYKVEKDYPIPLDFVKTVPKVWRTEFALKSPSFMDKDAPESVKRMFGYNQSADVSEEYGLTGKYNQKMPSSAECAYLCVYATGTDWTPVCTARRSFGKCRFTGLQDSVVYIPMTYTGGQLAPIGKPFYLDKGTRHEITPNMTRKHKVVLTRKYPFARSILRPWQETAGGCVTASQDKEFKNPDTLFVIDKTPVFRNVAYADSARRYRYMKYASAPNRRGAIMELCIYSAGRRMTGKLFADGAENIESIFDGDTFTGMEKLQPGYSVGLDMEKAVRVDSVAFYLRNDGNFIDIGDDYELLHYDNGWHPLGRQKAVAEHLVFDDVPVGALLLLKNRTKGSEERIFTYENGRQSWW
ncbi:transglutaminase domain-containing protein [Xylanibacter muris]|uniref:Transglutaminase domain-containing protein n=1 Tax=Xylanibacter muris TaxID=2736290 RepID=A0ABX2AKB6_9BACT|nr:transglutaminase domain-containing protein [Xylanibacter muris]NPD91636.1 transglutaminase domain-containing protein [Xylanibacter muris]